MDTIERPEEDGRRFWPRVIADLRLARRQVMRAAGSSVLVAALILLPMSVIVGALVFIDGRQPTTAERIHAELGEAQGWVAVVSGADPSLRQYLDQPEWWEIDRDESGRPLAEPQPAPESPVPFLPAGTEAIEIGEGWARTETAGGLASLTTVIGDAGAEVLRGRFTLHEGQPATGVDEAMVSPGALQRLGAAVGDTVTLVEPAGRYTIAGVLSRAEDADAAEVLFLPATPETRRMQTEPASTRWYLPEWRASRDDVSALNKAGMIVFDRDLVAHPGAAAAPTGAEALGWSLVALISAGAAFSGYLVVLLAGAAFSVSARRQQHALAVAASVGATRGDVFRIVLLQGTVLGLVGGIAGAGAGVGLGILLLHLFDDGAASSFWGVHVPGPALAAVVTFAVVIGTLAALVPARAATRGEVIAALRGSRKPVRVRVDRPLWGSLLLIVGVAVTAASAFWLAAINGEWLVPVDDPRRIVCIWGIILGPILLQVGVIVAGHWIIALVARALSRVGLAARLASRDAAANPGRIVPAFAAIAACAFLASTALGSLALVTGQQQRGWWYSAPVDTLSIYGWVGGGGGSGLSAEQVREAETRARDILDRTSPTALGTLWRPFDPNADAGADGRVDPAATIVVPQLQDYVSCDDVRSGECLLPGQVLVQGAWALAVVEPDDLATVVGEPISASDLATYREGGALLLDDRFATADSEVVLNRMTTAEVDDAWNGADVDVAATVTVPALVVDRGLYRDTNVLLSPAAAEQAGVVRDRGSWQVIAAYDEPPAPTERDGVGREVFAQDSAALSLSLHSEDGPPAADLWLLLVVGATAVLVVAASAVSLGLARVERRPDDATLAAVGGSHRLRRGIAGWQAIILVGIGMITGVVAGILPVWGVSLASAPMTNPPLFSDMPWVSLAALGLALPVAIAAVSWLVPPRRAALTRRTAIT